MVLKSYLPRFSIRQLLVWTAFIGFACVSLRSPSESWIATAFAVVLVILGATPMLVILRQGPERAYWMGFAVVGWLYLALLLYSFALEPSSVNSNPLSAGNLATARLSRFGHELIYGRQEMPVSFSLTVGTSTTNGVMNAQQVTFTGIGSNPATLRATSIRLLGVAPSRPIGSSVEDFIHVAHALWTLLLATCGGWFATWLYAARAEPSRVTSIAKSG